MKMCAQSIPRILVSSFHPPTKLSMSANNLNVGIKEVVTLTSDLSRKNLEKDFERMDTPQGTFYRMFQFQPLCRDSLIVSILTILYRRIL